MQQTNAISTNKNKTFVQQDSSYACGVDPLMDQWYLKAPAEIPIYDGQ